MGLLGKIRSCEDGVTWWIGIYIMTGETLMAALRSTTTVVSVHFGTRLPPLLSAGRVPASDQGYGAEPVVGEFGTHTCLCWMNPKISLTRETPGPSCRYKRVLRGAGTATISSQVQLHLAYRVSEMMN